MVHPAAPTPPNDGVSLTGPRRTAPTHLLVLAHTTPVHPHPPRHTSWTCAPSSPVPPAVHVAVQLLTGFGSCSPWTEGSPSYSNCLPLWDVQSQSNAVTTRNQLQGGSLIITQPKWWNPISMKLRKCAETIKSHTNICWLLVSKDSLQHGSYFCSFCHLFSWY